VLTGRGHEIAQVVTARAVDVGVDTSWLYYRDLGVALTLGVSPYEVFLGALGRAADPHSGGRQLTAHFSDRDLGIGSVSSEVGAHLVHAVGAAYAGLVKGTGEVAFCWFGDGAASEGAAHEAMNLAGVARLPVVFVCENNGLAISVPAARQSAGRIADRAVGYGFEGECADGTDAVAVHEVTARAVDRARTGGGPTLLELTVPRLVAHSSQDDDAYRSDADREVLRASDPVVRLRERCLDEGLLTHEDDADLVARADAEVRDAAKRALERAVPDSGRARRWLFAGDPAHDREDDRG
jgi:2-oxoisovalerate dehydrogenase E1 component alpha subunit